MLTNLLEEIIGGEGNDRQKKRQCDIVKTLAKSDMAMTIPEIANITKNSVPTTTGLITELLDNNWLIDQGKKVTDRGRKPTLFDLNTNMFYSVGVMINLSKVKLVISDLDASVVFEKNYTNFLLENTQECLDNFVRFVNRSIEDSKISMDKILGMGVGITGRVNRNSGQSLSYFNFMDKPLKSFLAEKFKFKIVIDNDTRLMGTAEQVLGKGRNIENALFVNVSKGLGLSMIFNGVTTAGTTGFAGEFGHMQFGKKNRLCLCGKQGCLGTEVSGHALIEDLKETLDNGRASIFFDKDKIDDYRFQDILKAAKKGDILSIELLQEQGCKLGESLGSILNLLNPELIVICGEIVSVKEIFADSVRMGLKKTTLINTLLQCELVMSELGEDAIARGATLTILKSYDFI